MGLGSGVLRPACNSFTQADQVSVWVASASGGMTAGRWLVMAWDIPTTTRGVAANIVRCIGSLVHATKGAEHNDDNSGLLARGVKPISVRVST
jgi:hypothetical protein